MNFPGILLRRSGVPGEGEGGPRSRQAGRRPRARAPRRAGGPVHRGRHHDRSRVLHQGRGARQARGRVQDLDPRRLGRPQLRRALHAARRVSRARRCSAATTSIRTSCCVGHINVLVRRAVERGIDVYDALRAACVVPVEHYGLDVGQLRVGDPADFIEVDSLTDFNVLRTWIDGQLVAENGKTTIPRVEPCRSSTSSCRRRSTAAEIAVSAPADSTLKAASDRSARRTADHESAASSGASHARGRARTISSMDMLKLVVVNRYYKAPPAVAFIKNFGLQARGDGLERRPRFAQRDRGRRRRCRHRGGGESGDGSRRRAVGRLRGRERERSAAAARRRPDGHRHLRRSRRTPTASSTSSSKPGARRCGRPT